LVIAGLGSTAWDITAAGDSPLSFPMWGAMGQAAMIGLGLALAQPKRRVLVITGDGEMLMGMGSLATIGVQQPPNLTVVVIDNQRYGETGMQPSHTDAGVDLVGVAKACGIKQTMEAGDQAGLEKLASLLGTYGETTFARVRIKPEEPPRVLPCKDGVELKNRFRRAVAAVG
jgi:thiamine pyrophosphate-dependent acetolactate synthase large subunit-like protein